MLSVRVLKIANIQDGTKSPSHSLCILQNYTTKLSDFGVSKDGPLGDETHVFTKVMGTYGFSNPEYVLTSNFWIFCCFT